MNWYLLHTSNDREKSFLDFLAYMESAIGNDGNDYSWRVYKANSDPFVIYLETANNTIIDKANIWFGKNIQTLENAPLHLDRLEIISQG